MLLDVRLGKASGFVTQSFVKAELLVSVVKVNSDPVFTQIGGGAGGWWKGGGSVELHW